MNIYKSVFIACCIFFQTFANAVSFEQIRIGRTYALTGNLSVVVRCSNKVIDKWQLQPHRFGEIQSEDSYYSDSVTVVGKRIESSWTGPKYIVEIRVTEVGDSLSTCELTASKREPFGLGSDPTFSALEDLDIKQP